MIVCIAGSRGIYGERGTTLVRIAMAEAMARFDFNTDMITHVMSGMCENSPDMIGVERARKLGIPVIEYPAKWGDLTTPNAWIRTRRNGTLYNARAGYDRNTLMAEHLARENGVAVLIWSGASGGTRHMRDECERLGVRHHVYVPCPF